MDILKIEATLMGLTRISFGKMFSGKKMPRETDAAFEARSWQERITINDQGYVVLPTMSLSKSLEGAAIIRKDKIPGQRNATFTKHFHQGIMEMGEFFLCAPDEGGGLRKLTAEDAIQERIFVQPSAGSTNRVERIFPSFNTPWAVPITLAALSDELVKHPDIIKMSLETAGILNGLGRWRPSAPKCPGVYGRFMVKNFSYEVVEDFTAVMGGAA